MPYHHCSTVPLWWDRQNGITRVPGKNRQAKKTTEETLDNYFWINKLLSGTSSDIRYCCVTVDNTKQKKKSPAPYMPLEHIYHTFVR